MQQLAPGTCETMLALIDALDQSAQHADLEHADLRSEGRRPVRTDCVLCLFAGSDPSIQEFKGVVRNIAFCGLSVLAALDGRQNPGRPIEVIVKMPGGTRTYMAGTIAFCRDVDGPHFELGIEVKAAGEAAILKRDPDAARSLYDWFADALSIPE